MTSVPDQPVSPTPRSDIEAAQLLVSLNLANNETPEQWAVDLASLDADWSLGQARAAAALRAAALKNLKRPTDTPRRASRLGIASFVLSGISAVLITFFALSITFTVARTDLSAAFGVFTGLVIAFYLPLLTSIIAGHAAAKHESEGVGRRSGITTAGLILGYVFGGIATLVIAFEVVLVAWILVGLSSGNAWL